jgi:hypothetical protein
VKQNILQKLENKKLYLFKVLIKKQKTAAFLHGETTDA